MYHNGTARIAAQGEELASRLDRTSDRIEELQRELAGKRVAWRSEDGLYRVAVDGNGRLLDLDIEPLAIRSAHPEKVGPAVVAAVIAARRAAVEVARLRWQEEFGSTTILDSMLPESDEPGDR
ncbi:MAG: hypothetical protein GEV03_25500 [Streptosporangiales bacterium]|nr:hypothetical protein [Streptosporangiales bacterium]